MVRLTKIILINCLLLLVSCGQKGPLLYGDQTLDQATPSSKTKEGKADNNTKPNKESEKEPDNESEKSTEETEQ